MRKFKIKDQVAQRLKKLENESTVPASVQPSPGASGPEESREGAEPNECRIVWRSDIGKIRRNNQDCVILGCGLAGVADGMGGHNGGEIASQGLRDGLLRELAGKKPDGETLQLAVEKVNLELWEKQNQDESLSGMGTTLTVLWIAEKEMIIAQVGDSRAYLLRDGEMRQITSDHSMVADLVRKGLLTEEQAACHPMRNYITRAVATESTIDVDLYTISRKAGDRWLICSDGLYGQITRGDLAELAAIEDMEEAASRLLDAALDAGGRDNVSLVLVQDEQQELPEETPEPETESAEDGGAMS